MKAYVTRIAPSPTGDMHIGTARTAYFNWLAARATGGKFILRIDDTDLKRSDPEYTKVILQCIDWLGLDYDDLVFQSKRFDRHRELAMALVNKGFAKVCDGGAIIIDSLVEGGRTSWKDWLAGEVQITKDDRNNVLGTVLMKGDGSTSYNWGSVVDDYDMGINLIIRGVDHLTNTSKQVQLHEMLCETTKHNTIAEWNTFSWPEYCHLGLICEKSKPLSKRDGASSLLTLRDKGYHRDAVLNFLVRLGWGPSVDDKTTALLPRERMLELFLKGGKMRSSPANVDWQKLESFDRKYKGRDETITKAKDRGQSEVPKQGG